MNNSSVTNVNRRKDDVLVTFADGHTYAFSHNFLYIYSLTCGQRISAALEEGELEDGSS